MSEEELRLEIRKLQKAARKQRMAGDSANLFGERPPTALLKPYPSEASAGHTRRGIQRKYQSRRNNVMRCWNRVQLFAPELMMEGPPQNVFELSTAHGAMLEVCRHFGHNILGNDYVNMVSGQPGESSAYRPLNAQLAREKDDHGQKLAEVQFEQDWPYRQIIEALDIPITIFDAGFIPYPLESKSQDYLFCFQAIEHYAHPDHWPDLVDEFCRIARKAVIILLNPLYEDFAGKPGYADAFEAARRDLKCFDRNGFRCTAVQMHWGQALGFKLTAC